MAGGNLPFGFAPSGSLTSYTPTLRERATDWLRQKLFSDDRTGQGRAERVMDVAAFTPFGFGVDMYDAGREAGMGNYGGAALTLGMAGMPGPSPKKVRAFHGSPHDFDRFSLDKIGTGEGAQAYGHGLYFAENEKVAQGYKNALRRMNDEMTFDGKPLKRPRDFTEIQTKLENDEGDWRLYKAVEEITARQGDMNERLSDIRNWYRNQPEMLAAIDRAEQRMSLNANPGSMYEVEIDADPDAFLDWDKPLNQQNPQVQDTMKTALGERFFKNAYDAMPEVVLRGAADTPDGASARLRGAGIPGIKYLDAGSRGAGDGTRNYVVFDDNLISIVRKYGIAGASALLGYNILDGMDPAQADELKRIEGNQ